MERSVKRSVTSEDDSLELSDGDEKQSGETISGEK